MSWYAFQPDKDSGTPELDCALRHLTARHFNAVLSFKWFGAADQCSKDMERKFSQSGKARLLFTLCSGACFLVPENGPRKYLTKIVGIDTFGLFAGLLAVPVSAKLICFPSNPDFFNAHAHAYQQRCRIGTGDGCSCRMQ
jgi:hypothetical protein